MVSNQAKRLEIRHVKKEIRLKRSATNSEKAKGTTSFLAFRGETVLENTLNSPYSSIAFYLDFPRQMTSLFKQASVLSSGTKSPESSRLTQDFAQFYLKL